MMNRHQIVSGTAVGLAILVSACGNMAPPQTFTAPSPSPASSTSVPAPAPNPIVFDSTLSGLVYEVTPSGRVPIEGADVEIGVCPPKGGAPLGYEKARTDATGFYAVGDMCNGVTYVWVSKPGYKTNPPRQCDGDCVYATVAGDTKFDIELVRQ
jgi:hypothetical protein